MRRYIGLGILFLLSVLLQSTLFNYLVVAGVKPDFVLLLVIYFAFTNGPGKGALLGLTFGLLEDFYVGRYIGMNALSLLLTGFIAGWFETKLYKENLLIALVVVFVASFFSQAVFLFSGIAAGLTWEIGDNIKLIWPLAVYNMCLVPITYPWFHRSITKGFLRYRPRHER